MIYSRTQFNALVTKKLIWLKFRWKKSASTHSAVMRLSMPRMSHKSITPRISLSSSVRPSRTVCWCIRRRMVSIHVYFLSSDVNNRKIADRMRPNVYLAVEITSGFLRVRHAGSTIYSKRRLEPDQTHLVSIIIGSQVMKLSLFWTACL